jgi:hypothetical protein
MGAHDAIFWLFTYQERRQMLKVFGFLSKREDLETQAFIDYYENHHVPLVLSMAPTPTIYKRNYLVRGDEFNREEETIDFDVITELVFPDRAAFVDWIEKLSVEGDQSG